MAVSRIVVRVPNWLGDIVMALPALATVRRQYPDAHLSVALPEGFAALMSAVPGVDGVVWLNRGGGLSAVDRNTRAVRAGNFDVGLLLTSSFASALILYQAEVPERWGYDGEMRGRLLTRAVVPPPHPQRVQGRTGDQRPMHQSGYYLRLLMTLGMRPVKTVMPLDVPPEYTVRVKNLFEQENWPAAGPPMVGVAPGAAYGSAKRWPAAHAAALVRRLIDAGLRPVLVGAKGDQKTADDVVAAIGAGSGAGSAAPREGEQYLNVVGKTDLATLMALLAQTEAVVSNDSGAMHLASALGKPVVALFGPTDEQVTSPIGPHTIVTHPVVCRPCMLRECPIDHRCMRDLTPDEVFAKLEDARRSPLPADLALTVA